MPILLAIISICKAMIMDSIILALINIMNAPSARVNQSDIARKDAFNRIGLRSISSNAQVKCRRHVTLSS